MAHLRHRHTLDLLIDKRDAVVADLDREIREAWGETVIAFT